MYDRMLPEPRLSSWRTASSPRSLLLDAISEERRPLSARPAPRLDWMQRRS